MQRRADVLKRGLAFEDDRARRATYAWRDSMLNPLEIIEEQTAAFEDLEPEDMQPQRTDSEELRFQQNARIAVREAMNRMRGGR